MNEFLQALFAAQLVHFHQVALEIGAALAKDDEHPFALAHRQLLRLRRRTADACVLLNQRSFSFPVDEALLSERLRRKINRFVQRTLLEGFLGAHIDNERDFFVVVHICALLGSRHSDV